MAILSLTVASMLAADNPMPHFGQYTPNSQLLSWCKSSNPSDYERCWTFIEGAVEASGMPDTTWPKGPIEVPPGVLGRDLIPIVVERIGHIAPENMAAPAVRSVYDAVVAVYPRKPQPAVGK